MQNRKRDIYVQNRLLNSVGEGEGGMFRENSIETCILSRVKQITSPGWMHETSAQGWCNGKTHRIGWRGRWEGRLGWGIHVNPWLIHVNVWQKPLQYCKVISLQLIKINRKKKAKRKVGCQTVYVVWSCFITFFCVYLGVENSSRVYNKLGLKILCTNIIKMHKIHFTIFYLCFYILNIYFHKIWSENLRSSYI